MMKHVQTIVIAIACCVTAAADDGIQEAVIDWSRWHEVLQANVSHGRVDYDGIQEDPRFPATVEDIAAANLSGQDPASVLAFYINSYNVLAVQGILDGHSPRSSLGKLRFFYRDKHTVAGERLTLNALEHDRIRPLGEPRIHFALVCASTSCPPLRNEAYLPGVMDEQLDDNARRFLNDPSKNRFDLDHGTAYLSKIFKWFAEDFEGAADSVQGYIADFIPDDRVSTALRREEFKVKYLQYDWSLNGTFGTR
jgi:hypothetical protein